LCERAYFRNMSRGFIVLFEGVDKSGKSSQAALLQEYWADKYGKDRVSLLRFPDRSTPAGRIIHEYLINERDLADDTIHLLFSANRRELQAQIRAKLAEPHHLIVLDRYHYSGMAYSLAKGMDLEFVVWPEHNIIQPDVVVFLHNSSVSYNNRGGERYETQAFQQQVHAQYLRMREKSWYCLDVNSTKIQATHITITNIVETAFATPRGPVLQFKASKFINDYKLKI
jgi:dTMP kinase